MAINDLVYKHYDGGMFFNLLTVKAVKEKKRLASS